MAQGITPDEIVVICHNCTDATVSIAQSFATIKVMEYHGPEGVPYARIKGFAEVTGDIIACLDGDSVASPIWLQNVTAPLIKDETISLVAGYVILTNNWFARLTSFWQFVLFKKLFKMKVNYFAWGSNFACRKSDYLKVGGMEPILELRQTLPLHFWAEDFYISLALMQIGTICFALKAKSYTRIPYWKINLKTAPLKEWHDDNRALLGYFKKRN
ncbi:MAG: glycosyl transferase family 2 [Candidatus Nomurabacteria bacterium]|nr:glycosyl transferase family 2 [Candidatus Nomurabacteria bacterium]